MTNYSPVIEKIHNEFNSAGDNLLSQAKEIISQVGESAIQKAERLQKIGFVSAKGVEQLPKVSMSREQATMIEYYKRKYPLHKFITDEQVNSICKKYNLVNAPISRYNGFVPESKLKQIEGANIEPSDVAEDHVRVRRCWNTGGLGEITFIFGCIGSGVILHKQIGKKTLSKSDSRLDWVGKDRLWAVKFNNRYIYVEKFTLIDKHSITICAPAKEFNLKGLKKGGLNFFSVKQVHIPDPVVLQPVKGGNLILAAWGDEASDPIVVNEVNN